ncbi:hypothetical protein NDI56_16410 [Haloarcula sp. S1CR25-12]|uniref:DUF7260 domain-containing protein n=1 Tax=Haloarcula saliterrae TaxID=2950534 RepID=A0ABU2FFD9_9EURY|nr:hypothetical protein [Haloarcula sp. S1CR25-12]MDS0260985.1 hypothetical protein [Haloarcula sp. S1CR25-12]
MPSHTRIHDALTRVQTEQDAVDAKRDAIDQFTERVEACSPAPSPAAATGATATVGLTPQRSQGSADKCQAVRQAFAETIRPHSLDDVDDSESLHETIQAELSESIAIALAPTTEATFSPELKQAVLSKSHVRRAATDTLRRALDREVSELGDARDTVDEITEWISTADETALTQLGFNELRTRHETLAVYRSRCEELASHRQDFLDGATSHGETIDVSHRNLVDYAYQDFPVDRPVLTTITRLDETCDECQRIVRQHLVRRV